MNLLLAIILIFSDSFFYGYCYEYRLAREKGNKTENEIGIFKHHIFAFLYNILHPVIKFLFWELPFRANTYVPLYRLLIQWPLDLLALWYLWNPHLGSETGLTVFGYYAGTWEFWGFLLFIYALGKEFGYYCFMGQIPSLKTTYEEESKKMPRKNIFSFGYTYWLERIYFAGAWLFMPYYTYKKFLWSSVVGLFCLIVSNFI